MSLESGQPEHPATPPTPPSGGDDGSNNHQLLIGALIVAGVIIAVLLMIIFGAGNPGRGDDATGPGGPGVIVTVPAPNPDQAQITVTAADGVNVRSGPGTQYDVVGIMPFGTQAPVVGRSQDGSSRSRSVGTEPLCRYGLRSQMPSSGMLA